MEITPLLMCCCSFQGLGKPEQWLLDSCCLRAGSVNPKGTYLCISQLLQTEPLPAHRVHIPEVSARSAGSEGVQGYSALAEVCLKKK